MTMPTNGQISLSQAATEFSRGNSLSTYTQAGSSGQEVGLWGVNTSAKLSRLYGRKLGGFEFTTAGTYNGAFTFPANVISMTPYLIGGGSGGGGSGFVANFYYSGGGGGEGGGVWPWTGGSEPAVGTVFNIVVGAGGGAGNPGGVGGQSSMIQNGGGYTLIGRGASSGGGWGYYQGGVGGTGGADYHGAGVGGFSGRNGTTGNVPNGGSPPGGNSGKGYGYGGNGGSMGGGTTAGAQGCVLIRWSS